MHSELHVRNLMFSRFFVKMKVIKSKSVSLCLLKSGDAACVPEANVVMHMTVEDFVTLTRNYIQVGTFAGRESEIELN